jgi:hypothetical protein
MWAVGGPHDRARARGRGTSALEAVEDKPRGVREFALLDLDNNQLRFGRSID